MMIRYIVRIPLLIILLLSGVFSVAHAQRDREEAVERLQQARNTLLYMVRDAKERIPKKAIAEAKAIVIVDQFKAGVIFGVKGGAGVALLHDDKGGWSPPAFYQIGGGSVGLQIGGESRYAVLLIRTREGTAMLTGKGGELGVDLAVAAGPTGANADFSNFDNVPIWAYSVSSGLYAGASLEGSVISPNQNANRHFYGRSVSALEILQSEVEPPKEAIPLMEVLSLYAREGGAGEGGSNE